MLAQDWSTLPSRARQAAAAIILAAGLSTVAAIDSVLAGACDSLPANADCQRQVQAPISYRGWQTQGWAYYCTGDHFYYPNAKQGHPGNWTSDNSCFTVIESVGAEDDIDKFDALITNWCLNDQVLTITLGCVTGSSPLRERAPDGSGR